MQFLYIKKILCGKVKIILEQRKVAFLSPSKICKNLNFSTFKNSKFRKFCWVTRTQPISVLKLFLFYLVGCLWNSLVRYNLQKPLARLQLSNNCHFDITQKLDQYRCQLHFQCHIETWFEFRRWIALNLFIVRDKKNVHTTVHC